MTILLAALVLFNAALFASGAVFASSPETFKGKTAWQWHVRYLKEHRALAKHGDLVRHARRVAMGLRRTLAHRPSSLEALRLAAVAYGQSYSDLVRVASCESPGLDPGLRNRQSVWNGEHATGLLQFLPSTFASTPYRSEDIYSPYANALAAGWMWDNGRRGEWACR